MAQTYRLALLDFVFEKRTMCRTNISICVADPVTVDTKCNQVVQFVVAEPAALF
jgi:hypothetical protein